MRGCAPLHLGGAGRVPANVREAHQLLQAGGVRCRHHVRARQQQHLAARLAQLAQHLRKGYDAVNKKPGELNSSAVKRLIKGLSRACSVNEQSVV
eukprot:8359971-Pyramimonas_sp.AAC.1